MRCLLDIRSRICVSIICLCVCLAFALSALECACNYECTYTELCRPKGNCKQRDVALGRPATASSLFNSSQWNEVSGPACLAVNGNTDILFKPVNQFPDSPNCVHTDVNSNPPYWEVDLGQVFAIDNFTFYARSGSRNKFRNATVAVDETECYTFPILSDAEFNAKFEDKIEISCTRQLQGRTVKIYKNTDLLEICEVQVWVQCDNNERSGLTCTDCGHCKNNTTCDVTSKTCPSGCEKGWSGDRCDAACPPGSYGENCAQTCGFCTAGSTCHHVTGVCLKGCNDGYTSEQCNTNCPTELYGAGCRQHCGHCGNGTCDHVAGICPAGCQMGYLSSYCNISCPPGWYGVNCLQKCGNCSRGDTCHHVTGVCENGCQPGYEAPQCDTRCRKEKFGVHCAEECGQCLNDSCRHDTGVCEAGCVEGFSGGLCKTSASASGTNYLPVIVGPVVAGGTALIIILVVFGILFVRRKRRKELNNDPLNVSATHAQSQQEHRGSRLPFSTTLTQSTAEELGQLEVNNSGKEKPNVVIPPTMVRSSHDKKRTTDQPIFVNGLVDKTPDETAFSSGLLDLEDESGNAYRNDESVYATFKASRPQLDKVQSALVDLLGSSSLSNQFQNLPKGVTDEHEAAKLPINVKKNRYYSVLPYDKTRVVLKDGYTEEKATDYINANFISGFHNGGTYIAAQGPRDNTVGDFWRMVWQENTAQIIMLTGLIEAGKSKCFEYWPARDKTETYGPVTVTGVDVQRRANFLVRTFVVTMKDSDEKRQVEQYHYLSWPDHGVPSTTSLVFFWRFVRGRALQLPDTPCVVHCTAGVGRTGTYIGLDIAYDQAVSETEVDIYEIVQLMRRQRCLMIQTEEQYVFLHKAVLEAYTARDTVIPAPQLDTVFPQAIDPHRDNVPRIDSEFQSITQMRFLAATLPTELARHSDNKSKNRNMDALPADDHLVYLTVSMAKRNQFINAVYMSTNWKQNGYILTQLPLKDTLVDFWRLVDGCDVRTIVSLGSEKEHNTVKDFCQFWPEDAGTSFNAGPYIIQYEATSWLSSSLASYTVKMSKKGSSLSREVQVLRYNDWQGELPGDTSKLLHLLDTLETIRQNETKPKPVVIQCLDGFTKSGLLCALGNTISRVTSDGKVDVYMSVREVHSVRPQAITSIAQYRFCYMVVKQRLSEINVYANL